MKKLVYLLLATTLGTGTIQAQEEAQPVRPAQVTFIPPMSSNGLEAHKYSNRISVNIFAGYNGGVDGIELGGFANAVKNDVHGAQLAGFTNVVMGRVDGVQLSGFANTTLKEFNGVQGAGFSNVALKGMNGAQLSGFSNFTIGETKGIQASGFVNVGVGSVKGIQIAGFANVATKDITGNQISGFANYAREVKGFQIGFINVCDTISKGVPIGFLSFVRKGYRAWEIEGNESFYVNAHFKTGTRKFYNIFGVGMRPESNRYLWGVGYGVGTMMKVSEKADFNLDFMAWQINEDEAWTDELHLLTKIKAGLAYNLGARTQVYGGVSWNVLVSQYEDEQGNINGGTIAPWRVTDRQDGQTSVIMYPGFQLGVRI